MVVVQQFSQKGTYVNESFKNAILTSCNTHYFGAVVFNSNIICLFTAESCFNDKVFYVTSAQDGISMNCLQAWASYWNSPLSKICHALWNDGARYSFFLTFDSSK